jgi:hypothetical protein
MQPRRPILILLILLLSAAAEAYQATPVRVADAECAKCHKEIFQRYLSTPMAHASGIAGENLIPGTFLHTSSGVEYTIANEHGNPQLAFHSTKEAGISGKYPLNYFLGSGQRLIAAIRFVSIAILREMFR